MSDELIIRKLKCPRCGYIWVPRVDHPRACPACKCKLGEVKTKTRTKIIKKGNSK